MGQLVGTASSGFAEGKMEEHAAKVECDSNLVA
jgi:hypothetical protein